jgi:hypothetical protein
MARDDPGLGAYGVRLANVDEAAALLVPAAPDWPALEVAQRVGPGEAPYDRMTNDAATLTLRNGGEIVIERREGRVTFVLPRPLGAAELVHPLLAPVGGVMAWWHGRESFHAGAFVLDGRAWAILGERGAGKSTAIAHLALRGHGVVCDDLLVVDGRRTFAGPRSVDLRESAAERLDAGEALGMVGARERWRLRVGPVDGALELAGWVFLGWDERVEVVPLPARERLGRITAQRGVTIPLRDPTAMLDLAALPGLELRRPRSWDSLDAAADALLDALS